LAANATKDVSTYLSAWSRRTTERILIRLLPVFDIPLFVPGYTYRKLMKMWDESLIRFMLLLADVTYRLPPMHSMKSSDLSEIRG
jgi:hypothetical protein